MARVRTRHPIDPVNDDQIHGGVVDSLDVEWACCQRDKLIAVPLQFEMTDVFGLNLLGKPVTQVNMIGAAVPA
jgi:hypothetical protein